MIDNSKKNVQDNNYTWEEQQAKVADYLRRFFDKDERQKMVFVSNAPKDTKIIQPQYYR